jgi:DNA-binding CsgD family transcriptional regulator
LKEQWIERTRKRFNADDSNKNLRALDNVKNHYEDNIKDMMSSGLSYYEIGQIDYDLRDVVKHLKGVE